MEKQNCFRDCDLKLYIACLCDVIWKWRNKIVFDKAKIDMENIAQDLRFRYQEMLGARSVTKTGLLTHEALPPPEFLKEVDTVCFQTNASVVQKEAGLAIWQ
uniref:Uncharacterized protein n=1 Tax=Cannabis sativa TaxID=3483 RepID=A0A803QAX7_CANSA